MCGGRIRATMISFIDELSWKYQAAIPVEIVQRGQGGELVRHSYRASLRHPSIRSENARMATSELGVLICKRVQIRLGIQTASKSM